ncbi:hypothetical protein M0804_005976 [Polistes exclamans]|nr:hypothetical protein M0804_005976 [Polistes exclamans]
MKKEGKYQIRIGQDQNSADGLDKLLDLWISENDVLKIASATATAKVGWVLRIKDIPSNENVRNKIREDDGEEEEEKEGWLEWLVEKGVRREEDIERRQQTTTTTTTTTTTMTMTSMP